MSWIRKEPVRFAVLFLSLVSAVIALLRVFDVALTDGQVDAITELTRVGIEVAVFVATGELVRSGVSPTALLAMISVGLALSTTGCGSALAQNPAVQTALQNPGDTAEFLAQQACARSYAEKKKIDIAQAQTAFCNSFEQIRPWVKPIVDALLKGEERAIERDARASSGE